jgi:hypothetical protein
LKNFGKSRTSKKTSPTALKKSYHFADNNLDGNKMERTSKNKTGSVLEVEVGQTKGLATALEHFVPTKSQIQDDGNGNLLPSSHCWTQMWSSSRKITRQDYLVQVHRQLMMMMGPSI